MRPRGSRRQWGFTVIEIMVTMAILGVLAAVGVPQMTSLIRTSKVRSAASDFYSALLTARSEAIKRRTNVTVAPLGATWPTGWKVTFNSGANTMMSVDALASDVSVAIRVGGAVTTTTSNVVFGSNGRVTSAVPTLVFYNSSDSSVQARCVGLDASGMPRIRMDTDSNASDGCD